MSSNLEERARRYADKAHGIPGRETGFDYVVNDWLAGYRAAIADAARVAKLAEQRAMALSVDEVSNVAARIAALAPPA